MHGGLMVQPNDTRVSNSADLQIGSTCSFALAAQDGTDPVIGPPETCRPLPQHVSRFQIRRQLGHGAFGAVYLAHDPTLNRDVALKVPRATPAWTDKAAKKFLDEARIAAQLKHPNVVTIYDAGRCDTNGVFIAMEYVEGETLAERLKRGKLEVADAVRICAQIADAIHQGHKLGMVHRDLKPSNVLIDGKGNAKVCDFGLALEEGTQDERRGEISGTYAYMSPEQHRGDSHLLDGRSDIWSLGVIFYECLAGRPPFRGKNRVEVYEEILTRDPRPLRQLDDSIPEPLDALCRRCLSRNVAERLATALDFQRALTEGDGGRKGRERTRLVWAALAALGVVLAANVAAYFVIPRLLSGPADVKAPRPAQQAASANPAAAGETSPAGPHSSLSGRPAPRTIDLLEQPPRVVLFAGDLQNPFLFNQATHRLTVKSMFWSLFACGEHSGDMRLEVTADHGNPPAWAGVFWGLNRERAPADAVSQQSCLAAIVRPKNTANGDAEVCLFRLVITKDKPDSPPSLSTHEMARAGLNLDWTEPVNLRVHATSGKLSEVRIQGAALQVPDPAAPVEWTTYSAGMCGLVTFQVHDRVDFTNALLVSATQE